MADQHARILSQPSNRARPKDARDKKVVFKGVLDSPLRVQWPSVPLNLQNEILATIIQLLDGASNYHDKRSSLNRQRKRAAKVAELSSSKKKKRKIVLAETPAPADIDIDITHNCAPKSVPDTDGNASSLDHTSPNKQAADRPPILHHLIYGINEVTKVLETQIQSAHRPIVFHVPEQSIPITRRLKYVFVCRADVDPPLLIDHLPHLVAALNSIPLPEPIKLVPLPKGSESSLAQTLGIRRVAVLAISIEYPDPQGLIPLLEQIPVLAAPWLSRPESSRDLVATHVKQLRTTAPRDMKVAKELRNQGRARAKQKHRERLSKKHSTQLPSPVF